MPTTSNQRHPNDAKRDIALIGPLNLDNTFKFALDLESLKHKSVIHIDLGPKKHVSPFSMLFLGLSIKNFIKENRGRLVLHNFSQHTYLGHMGFFLYVEQILVGQ